MGFYRQGKLNPKYIGPFEILRIVSTIAYEITLPLVYSGIHPVFHVLLLCWCVPYESHVLWYDSI